MRSMVTTRQAEGETGRVVTVAHSRRRDGVLAECVLRAVSRHYARPMRDIHYNVINDYGSVTERSLYRVINHLLTDKYVVRVRDEWSDGGSADWGYLRVR